MKVSWNNTNIVVKTSTVSRDFVFEIRRSNGRVNGISVHWRYRGEGDYSNSIVVDIGDGAVDIHGGGVSVSVRSDQVNSLWFTNLDELLSEIKSDPEEAVYSIIRVLRDIVNSVFSSVPID